MAGAAIIGTALNTAAAHIYGLFLEGLDVVREPVNGRYGVPLESVHVTEAGPGSVSSMSFTIDDPFKLISIPATCHVLFWDFARDLPIFRGFVQHVRVVAAFGQQGRSIDVTCYGLEAILDQYIVPALTAGLDEGGTLDWAGSMAQRVTSYAPLRNFRGTGFTYTSSLALPIQNWSDWFTDGSKPLPVLDGMSLRTAFETWLSGATWSSTLTTRGPNVAFTVDFWEGVRCFDWGANAAIGSLPSDYAALVLTESSTPLAGRLTWESDTSPGAVTTQVYVKGGNADTTGWVAGDTTQGAGQSYVSNASLTFDFEKADAANAILARRGTGAGRGTVDLENYTPTNLHPGSLLTITNAALGWTSKQFVISQVDRTNFTGDGRQDWRLTFFELVASTVSGQPSAMDSVRTLTRAVTN